MKKSIGLTILAILFAATSHAQSSVPPVDAPPHRLTASESEAALAFTKALLGNKLLNAENTQRLITGRVDTPAGGKYAYGFDDQRKNGKGSLGHGGGASGMSGMLRIFPASGYVMIVLSNLDPPAAQRVASFLELRLEN